MSSDQLNAKKGQKLQSYDSNMIAIMIDGLLMAADIVSCSKLTKLFASLYSVTDTYTGYVPHILHGCKIGMLLVFFIVCHYV
jgi:hypothetical protein